MPSNNPGDQAQPSSRLEKKQKLKTNKSNILKMNASVPSILIQKKTDDTALALLKNLVITKLPTPLREVVLGQLNQNSLGGHHLWGAQSTVKWYRKFPVGSWSCLRSLFGYFCA